MNENQGDAFQECGQVCARSCVQSSPKKKKKVKSMLNVKTFRESSGRGLKKDVY
jgi:hypothetical protein